MLSFFKLFQLTALFYIMDPSKYWLYWNNIMVKNFGSRAKKPKSEFQLLQLLAGLRAMCSRTRYLIFLYLSVLFYKMGIIMVPTS